MWNTLRVILVIVLFGLIVVGLFAAQSYADEAARLRNPSLNCQPGWTFLETPEAQICVLPKDGVYHLQLYVGDTNIPGARHVYGRGE